MEHHSNYVPWHYLRNKKKANIKFAKINKNLEIEVDEIKKLITNKTKMIAITHISNVTGGITPLKEIIDLASSKNIPVLVDGTQGRCPSFKIRYAKIRMRFLCYLLSQNVWTKWIKILYGKKKWLDIMPPYQGGGGMINEVKKENITFAERSYKIRSWHNADSRSSGFQ